jgi:hypothetical protein
MDKLQSRLSKQKQRDAIFELMKPESRLSLFTREFLPSEEHNSMSSAISLGFPSSSPFAGISTGIQSSQRNFAFGLTPMVVSHAVQRFQFLLERRLKSVGRGTPLDGNCLYHAVVQAQNGGEVDHDAAAKLRELAVNWALNPANLPTLAQNAFDHGAGIDELIDTLSTNGDWSGDPGDLTAQGNALGKVKPKISPERAPHFVATKRQRIKSLRPFRARSSQLVTQGAALGYHIAPRWGLI